MKTDETNHQIDNGKQQCDVGLCRGTYQHSSMFLAWVLFSDDAVWNCLSSAREKPSSAAKIVHSNPRYWERSWTDFRLMTASYSRYRTPIQEQRFQVKFTYDFPLMAVEVD